jgi:hypothetical protein
VVKFRVFAKNELLACENVDLAWVPKRARVVFDPHETLLVYIAPMMLRLQKLMKLLFPYKGSPKVVGGLAAPSASASAAQALPARRYVMSCGATGEDLGLWYDECLSSGYTWSTESDGSGYDSTMGDHHIAGLKVFLRFLKVPANVITRLFTGMGQPIVATNRKKDVVIKRDETMLPTGHPCTYVFNTLRNLIESAYVFRSLTHFSLLVSGDDMLLLSPKHNLTEATMVAGYKCYGTVAKMVMGDIENASVLSSEFIPCDGLTRAGEPIKHCLMPSQPKMMAKLCLSYKACRTDAERARELAYKVSGLDKLMPVCLAAKGLIAWAIEQVGTRTVDRIDYRHLPVTQLKANAETTAWHDRHYPGWDKLEWDAKSKGVYHPAALDEWFASYPIQEL